MKEEIYDLLIRSFDETLSVEEQIKLEQALAQSETLRNEKEQLLRMRTSLGNQTYRFNPFFASKVMNRLDPKGSQEFTAWRWAFRRIAFPGLALLILLFLFTWVKDGSLSWDVLTGVSSDQKEALITEYYSETITYN